MFNFWQRWTTLNHAYLNSSGPVFPLLLNRLTGTFTYHLAWMILNQYLSRKIRTWYWIPVLEGKSSRLLVHSCCLFLFLNQCSLACFVGWFVDQSHRVWVLEYVRWSSSIIVILLHLFSWPQKPRRGFTVIEVIDFWVRRQWVVCKQ